MTCGKFGKTNILRHFCNIPDKIYHRLIVALLSVLDIFEVLLKHIRKLI
jgi:ABC-type uncharacterized transport system ATPase subunit